MKLSDLPSKESLKEWLYPSIESEYPDNNHNGIPDAFENRLPISEILNDGPAEEPVVPKPKQKASWMVTPLRDLIAPHRRDETEPPAPEGGETIAVEIEQIIRSARQGEWVLTMHGLERCARYDHNRYRGYVIRRFIK